MSNKVEITPWPALLRHVPYAKNGVLTELDCYVYIGIPGLSEQYVDHLGIVTVKDGVFFLPGSDASYTTQEEAINALFERWQKGNK